MEKKQKEPKPVFEVTDPKPPVIHCGKGENRIVH